VRASRHADDAGRHMKRSVYVGAARRLSLGHGRTVTRIFIQPPSTLLPGKRANCSSRPRTPVERARNVAQRVFSIFAFHIAGNAAQKAAAVARASMRQATTPLVVPALVALPQTAPSAHAYNILRYRCFLCFCSRTRDGSTIHGAIARL